MEILIEALLLGKLKGLLRKDGDDDTGPTEGGDVDEEILKTTKVRRRPAWLASFEKMKDDDLFSSRTVVIIQVYSRIIEENPVAKIIIFSKFLKFLDIVEEALKRKLRSTAHVLRFDGTVNIDGRKDVKSQFNSSKGSVVLRITPGAGGAGLNLNAREHIIRCKL